MKTGNGPILFFFLITTSLKTRAKVCKWQPEVDSCLFSDWGTDCPLTPCSLWLENVTLPKDLKQKIMCLFIHQTLLSVSLSVFPGVPRSDPSSENLVSAINFVSTNIY